MSRKLILLKLILLILTQFTNPLSAYECTTEGYFDDLEDCTKYHSCQPNEAGDLWHTELTCSPDLVWCQDTVQCETQLICPCPSTTESPIQTETTEMETLEPETEIPTTEAPAFKPRNCLEIQNSAQNPRELNNSLTYEIFPFDEQISVLTRCDFETEGGGWTVIQRRESGPKEEFYKDWVDYENGFGSPQQNYWIGLKVIHSLTSDPQQIRFELSDWEGNHVFAHYAQFYVADASDWYRLFVNGYSGTAGDSMLFQNNMQFTTRDGDHDIISENCAQVYHGAWWYQSCHASNLNGLYWGQGEEVPYGDGVMWKDFKGHYYSLKFTEIKIRTEIFAKSRLLK